MNKVTFYCPKDDDSATLAVQLEPEAWTYTIGPGEELTFVALTAEEEFGWGMSVGEGWVQLIPNDGKQTAEILIYQNGIQIPNLAYPIE
ncbi:MAG TPA: hypothetical protein VFO93_18185 [Hymenobacter sp.]|uniref:hypothetical protein n=1 Tax=Hymenobacter sp. TaxID=1898978 RepID=UPI002D7E1C68|nr:hypothetical protein [Hymenobacter sp.]HET9505478.1 hypothetical protein [Hymenobacter sp.]